MHKIKSLAKLLKIKPKILLFACYPKLKQFISRQNSFTLLKLVLKKTLCINKIFNCKTMEKGFRLKQMFQKIEIHIKSLLNHLRNAHLQLKENGYGKQKFCDFSSGYIVKNGIMVPLKTIEYRFFCDHYEQITLNAFINLTDLILTNSESPFAMFALRTIQEMSFQQITVLFSKELPETERELIKIISTLTDLASMSKEPFRKHFLTFYSEVKMKLDIKVQALFDDIEKTGYNPNILKKIRNRFGKILLNRSAKVPKMKTLKIKLDPFRSSWSHMLHGDPFFIGMVIDANKRPMNIFYGVISECCVNAALRVANFLDNKPMLSEIEKIRGELDELWRGITSASK